METIDLSPQKTQIKFEDKTYPVRIANLLEVKGIEKQMKQAGEDTSKILDVQKNLMVKCGMPGEIVDKLEMSKFSTLAEFIMGAKKN